MRSFKYKFDRKTLEIFYFSFIRPIMEYGNILFAGETDRDLMKINNIEKQAKRIGTGAIAKCNLNLLDIEVKWESIETRRNNSVLIMLYKIINGDAPSSLINIFNNVYGESVGTQYNLRNTENYKIPYCKAKYYKASFFLNALAFWNNLPNKTRLKSTLSIFKSHLKRETNLKNILF